MRRPAFWLVLAVFSIASAVVAVRYFPRAFSIVALDITMDREQALAQARDVMAREVARAGRVSPGRLVHARR